MPPALGVSVVLVVLLVALLALLTFAEVAAVIRYRRTRSRNLATVAIVLGTSLAVVGSAFAFGVYQTYVTQSTWRFGYSVEVQSNGTANESIIVPVPRDEGLLAGLRLASGHANWSLVTTSRGRGLFVQFAGAADLDAYMSAFPPPSPLPDASPTLEAAMNCTAQPSNCTDGPPMFWIFYSGPSGASLSFSVSNWYVNAPLREGWDAYMALPPPAAVP